MGTDIKMRGLEKETLEYYYPPRYLSIVPTKYSSLLQRWLAESRRTFQATSYSASHLLKVHEVGS